MRIYCPVVVARRTPRYIGGILHLHTSYWWKRKVRKLRCEIELFLQQTPKTSQVFKWWGRQYLNCQPVHSNEPCVFDTSCFFVSYNAHLIRWGVLTQAAKCLLIQIYMVESAPCAGWAIIKTNEPASAVACKSLDWFFSSFFCSPFKGL